ncbi:CRE-AAT-6 protein, partial [Aphelenchoides avenae]
YAMAFAFMSVGCVLNWPCAVAIQAKTFSEYVFQGFGISIGHTWTYVVKKLIELTLI